MNRDPEAAPPGKPRQLSLEFPVRSAKGRADFMVTQSNAAAIDVIDRWPEWQGGVVALFGPPGCGKSHLIAVWHQRGGGQVLDGQTVDLPPPDRVIAKSRDIALDNAAAAARRDPEWVLHLFNLIREERGTLLLASELPPAGWAVALPDLDSRLRTSTTVEIGPPDDDLVVGLLLKLFADRQLTPDQEVITYLLPRVERSFDGVRRLVRAIDRAAAEKKQAVTVPLVRAVLRQLGQSDATGPPDRS